MIDLTVVCPNFDTTLLDEDDKTALANAFVSMYNKLISNYCDKLFWNVTGAIVSNIGAVRDGGMIILIEMLVDLECLGCDPLVDGLYTFPSLPVEVSH